jgi:cytochrome c oxidase cbb3-type subunit I/II
MWDPTSMSPGSLMPRYPWLFTTADNDATLNTSSTKAKLEAMKALGVPYEDVYIENWQAELESQAREIAETLNADPNIKVEPQEEIVALIAYLQRLGTDVKKAAPQTAKLN